MAALDAELDDIGDTFRLGGDTLHLRGVEQRGVDQLTLAADEAAKRARRFVAAAPGDGARFTLGTELELFDELADGFRGAFRDDRDRDLRDKGRAKIIEAGLTGLAEAGRGDDARALLDHADFADDLDADTRSRLTRDTAVLSDAHVKDQAPQATRQAAEEAREKETAALAFTRDFRTRLEAGDATHGEIAAAETAGTLSPGRVAGLRAELADDQARRTDSDARAGRITALLEAGDRPDPNDPDDRADLAHHFEATLKPALADMDPARKAAAIGAYANDTGIVPDAVPSLSLVRRTWNAVGLSGSPSHGTFGMARVRSDGHAAAGAIDGREAWLRLAVTVLLAVIGCAGMWIVVLILPTAQAEFGTDRADASLPFTFMTFGLALGNLVGGRWVDRLGITVPAIVAACLMAIGYVGAAYSRTIWQFAVVHGVFIGTGISITFGPLIANISHWFERRRGIAVAVTATGNYIAGALWPPLMQGFIETVGWRATYTGIGVFSVLAMVPLALLLRRAAPTEDRAGTGGAARAAPARYSIDVSPTGFQMLLSVAGVGCCVAMAMPQVHIVAYCADLGFGVARGAEMLSLMLGAGIVSRLTSGFLADWMGGVRTALLGSVLQCLALVFFLPFDGLVSLYVLSFMFGLAQGGIIPCYAIIIREYLPAGEAGRRIGFVIMATILGMALGGWMSGWIFDMTGSYRTAFVNGIGWNILNMAVFALILWRTGRSLPAPA